MSKTYLEYRGVDNLVAAEVLVDNEDEIVFGTVFPVAGSMTITRTTDSQSDPHYYDNKPVIVVTNDAADTVTIEGSALPLDVFAKLTGQAYDPATGMLVEGKRQTKYFAIGYITSMIGSAGDSDVYVWRLKCMASVPDTTSTTRNAGTDANGQQLVLTGISTTHKFTKTGDSAKAVDVNVGLGLVNVDNFFDTVQTPDTITPIVPPAPTYFTVSYNANTGTGTVEPVTVLAGSSILLDDGSGLTAPDASHEFAGWAKTSGAATPTVTSPCEPTADTTLYAVWTEKTE